MKKRVGALGKDTVIIRRDIGYYGVCEDLHLCTHILPAQQLEAVPAVRDLHVLEVKAPDVIAVVHEEARRISIKLALGIRHNKRVASFGGLKDIGLHEAKGLAGAGGGRHIHVRVDALGVEVDALFAVFRQLPYNDALAVLELTDLRDIDILIRLHDMGTAVGRDLAGVPEVAAHLIVQKAFLPRLVIDVNGDSGDQKEQHREEEDGLAGREKGGYGIDEAGVAVIFRVEEAVYKPCSVDAEQEVCDHNEMKALLE